MFELSCPVRKCNETLRRNERGLTCHAGHHFDRAKAGYWSLLQPQDRKSLHPGDCDEAVLARRRWLERGYAGKLIDELDSLIQTGRRCNPGLASSVLDLGCGEGSFGPALFPNGAAGFCGMDLSKRAVKLAAKGWPEATWVLANADRPLPVADLSVHCVMSLFGRRPTSEMFRVLVPGGCCIIAVPGEEDLIELRETVQQTGHLRSRWEAVVQELVDAGLEFVEHRLWRQQLELQPDAIADALAMTYRAVRRSQQSRVETLTVMNVTLAADLLLLRRPTA